MELAAQLEHLDRVLLSTVTTAFPDELTDEDKAATHAYLVLAHAVLEEHLEAAFDRHYDRLSGWPVSDLIPLEAARLAFAVRDWLPKELEVSYKKRSLRGLVGAAKACFSGHIRDNHGIKPDNVSSMCRLVGLDWKDFESALNQSLEDLRTLGVKRGEAGHLSPYTDKAVRLTRQDYPDNVREWVAGARDAVDAISNYLDSIVRQQQPLSLISDWDGN